MQRFVKSAVVVQLHLAIVDSLTKRFCEMKNHHI